MVAALSMPPEHAVGCDRPAPTLSVVIPVYNGAGTIGELVAALSGLAVEGGLEIVLVNDGSPDDSDRVCRALLETCQVPITYVEHARNYGEHNAVMTGLRHARGAFVITMDDDLQNPPEEVLRLLHACRDGGYDVVYTFYAEKKHAWWRNLGSRFANWVADLLLDKPRGVYLSSFRCLNRLVVDGVTRYEGPFPYVDGLIMEVTQRIGTLEVRHLPRAAGRSNYTLRRLVRLWLNLAFNFSLLPLRLAVLAGLGMAAVGALAALYVVLEALFGEPPAGWASTITVVLLLSGVQLFVLGMIGEYIGRTFLTGNRKPQGIVRKVERSSVPAVVG
ncbi:MAG: glycosyltransferase family 2 protein [Elioraea sp.]|nr:glycosyltransferase family 2 protein [Elioraea sp.]